MALLIKQLPDATSLNVPDTIVARDEEGTIEVGNLASQGITSGGLQINGFSQLNGGTELLPASASGVPVKIIGASSQTAHLTDWKDNNGNVLSYVASDGEYVGAINYPSFHRTTYLLPDQDSDSYSGSTVIALRGLGDTTANTGTVTAQVPTATEPATARYATSATSNTFAGANGADWYRVGRNHLMQCRVKLSATVNMRVFVGLSTNTPTNMTNTDSPTGDFAGFRFSTTASETTWKVLTRDNTTTTNTATGVNIASAQGFNLEIQEDVANSRWLFRIDGTLVATVTSTLPRSSPAQNLHYVVAVGTTEAVAKSLDIGWVFIKSDM